MNVVWYRLRVSESQRHTPIKIFPSTPRGYRRIESSVSPVKKGTGDTASVGLTLCNTFFRFLSHWFGNTKTIITVSSCTWIDWIDFITLGREKIDLGPKPRVDFKIISVRRKKGFWTWNEKMRWDIWRTNILQGAGITELYLWPKKSAIEWIFGPQTAFESTSSNLRPKTVWCLDFVLWR